MIINALQLLKLNIYTKQLSMPPVANFSSKDYNDLRNDMDTFNRLIEFWCFNATFQQYFRKSWRPVLVVEEAGVPLENHRPWASNW